MKLTVIRTGGTIGCVTEKSGVIALEKNAGNVRFDGFDTEVVTPFYELSERLGARHYDALTRQVLSAEKNSDAIVITHGSDTLPYTASVLAFAIGKTEIPIVFVCSDKPLSDPTASGHVSLKTAAAFIKSGENGVFVADGTDVHFAVRLLEDRAYDEGFYSAHNLLCARVTGQRVKILETGRAGRAYAPLESLSEKKILYIKPYPDMDYGAYTSERADCILHDSYHSGTADERKLNRFARGCSVPLYLVGGSGGKVYSSKAGFCDRIKVLDNITLPALYAKLLVGLNRFPSDPSGLDEYLKTDLCGEFFA